MAAWRVEIHRSIVSPLRETVLVFPGPTLLYDLPPNRLDDIVLAISTQ